MNVWMDLHTCLCRTQCDPLPGQASESAGEPKKCSTIDSTSSFLKGRVQEQGLGTYVFKRLCPNRLVKCLWQGQPSTGMAEPKQGKESNSRQSSLGTSNQRRETLGVPRMANLRQRNVLVSLPYSPAQVGRSGYLPEAGHYVCLQKGQDSG